MNCSGSRVKVRRPAAVVEFGELGQAVMGDHMMAEQWLVNAFLTEPGPEVDKKRHGRVANYSYVDGHVLTQDFKETFNVSDPCNFTDNWNPGTAR